MKLDRTPAVTAAIMSDISGFVKEMRNRRDESSGTVLEATEDELRVMLRRWAGLVLKMVAESLREEVEREVRCRCGERGRYKGEQERQQETLVGPFRYRRGYWYCHRCGKGWYPLDEALGVDEGQFSSKLELAMSLLGVDLAYRSAAQALDTLVGVQVSASSVERVVKRRGTTLDAHYRAVEARLLSGEDGVVSAALAESGEKRPWVVELDAANALFRDGWHEVKVGVVCVADNLEASSGERPSYVARVRDMDGAGKRLYAEAVGKGIRPERDTVVCLADGAPVNWSQFELHFPHRVEVLDYYHAVEHLWVAGKAGLGEDSDKTQTWVEEQSTLLWQGEVPALLTALETLAQRTGSEAVAREARYFRTNQERIKYNHYRQCGYPIGSGKVESACKQLVTARLKGPGMRWSDQGAQSVLTLRCALLSQRWDQAWSLTKAA